MSRAKTIKNDEFTQGFACACATMLHAHGESTMVRDCYICNFRTVEQLRRAGVDDYDIQILKPIIKEIQERRARRLKEPASKVANKSFKPDPPSLQTCIPLGCTPNVCGFFVQHGEICGCSRAA
jgi:hypothetical protein